MKKVLIIANLFHASPRIPGLTSYLPEFGWEATIITPPLSPKDKKFLDLSLKFFEKTKIVEAPYKGDILWFWRKLMAKLGFKKDRSLTEQLKEKIGIQKRKGLIDKLLFLYQSIFGFPDTERYWLKPALKTSGAALRPNKFDALISSSPYPTSHFVAEKIKKEFKIPWLADFRDPWSQNHDYPYGPIRKILDTKLEKKTIKTADAIVAASFGYSKKQEKLHQRPVFTITNGFDPELINNTSQPLTKKFTITYTGKIYAGKQDPTKLFAGVSDLIMENLLNPQDIEIRFYEKEQVWLEKEIKKYGLQNIAIQHGQLPRMEAIKRQQESQILLLLCWEDLTETGVYPLKIFEYLASQRPILATGGSRNEDVKRIIKETKSGVSAITVDEIKNCLKIFYQEYKRTGRVSCQGDLKKIEQYSYLSMAKKFAEILNYITL